MSRDWSMALVGVVFLAFSPPGATRVGAVSTRPPLLTEFIVDSPGMLGERVSIHAQAGRLKLDCRTAAEGFVFGRLPDTGGEAVVAYRLEASRGMRGTLWLRSRDEAGGWREDYLGRADDGGRRDIVRRVGYLRPAQLVLKFSGIGELSLEPASRRKREIAGLVEPMPHVVNGDMSVGAAIPTGWDTPYTLRIVRGGVMLHRDTEAYRSPPASLAIRAGKGESVAVISGAVDGAKAGKRYAISAWLCGSARMRGVVRVQIFDHDYEAMETREIRAGEVGDDGWVNFVGTVEMPERAGFMNVEIHVDGEGSVWVDDVTAALIPAG